jgi:hypothetical protein
MKWMMKPIVSFEEYPCHYHKCIWQLKNAINGSISNEFKKSQNTQVMYKNLHILGSFFYSLLC